MPPYAEGLHLEEEKEYYHTRLSKKREENMGSDDIDSSPSESVALSEDAQEAAAIAAAAEKAEARRTTRLAAGKIKQVDYNAPVIKKAKSVDPGPETSKKKTENSHRGNGFNGGEEARKGRMTRSTRSRMQEGAQERAKNGLKEKSSLEEEGDGNEMEAEEDNSRSALSSTPTASLTPEVSVPLLFTDEQGWNRAAIEILSSAIAGAKSLDVGKLMSELSANEKWEAQEKSERDVEEYISTIKKKIKAFASSMFSKDIKYSAFLAYVSNERHRLMHSKRRARRKVKTTVTQERRLRTSLDKKRKRAKKELEEVRIKLDNEMGTRRQSELQLAGTEVQILDAHRMREREKAKRHKSKLDHDLFVRKRQDLANRLKRLETAIQKNDYLADVDDQFDAHDRELERLEKVVLESERELMKAMQDAEDTRTQLETVAKEKSRLERDLYVMRTGRRLGFGKRSLNGDEPLEAPRARKRKTTPVRSPTC